jgi:hypothetical protein
LRKIKSRANTAYDACPKPSHRFLKIRSGLLPPERNLDPPQKSPDLIIQPQPPPPMSSRRSTHTSTPTQPRHPTRPRHPSVGTPGQPRPL